MKKFFTLVFLLSFLVVNARHFSPDEAKSFAQNFLEKRSLNTRSINSERKLSLVNEEGNKPFYAFNIENSEGFIVVSSQGENPMVLGFSDKGEFDLSNLPPQLNGVLSKMSSVKEKSMSMSAHSTRSEGNGVLYATADWGQGAPFNNLCPEMEGTRAQTGCVATALAITMQYHNWPDYTHGGEEWNYYDPELKFDFDNYVIDWKALSDSNNAKFAEEVSKLNYSLGVAAPMIYGVLESSAEVWPVSQKLIQYYYYSKDCQYLQKNSMDDAQWNELLIKQLNEVGPVIYNGGSEPGHCFVIDGYSNDGYYHVNWGWDGGSNGYWALDFSNIGGLDFSQYQGMIINIKPDLDHHEYSKMFIPNAEVFANSETNIWNFSTPDINPGELIRIKSPFIVLNKMIGFYTLGVVDQDDKVIQILDIDNWFGTADQGLNCAYPGTDPSLNCRLPGLKEGQRYQWVSYDMDWEPDYQFWNDPLPETKPEDWKLILGGIVTPAHFYDKGNFSYLIDINYHITDKVPVFMDINNTIEKEFTQKQLWGSDNGENLYAPKGITFKVVAKDRDGNIVDPIYVDQEEEFGRATNVSIYQHHYDIYVDYEDDGNTRHDSEINPEEIIVKDGLVYHLKDGGATLIGYENQDENIVVPAFVSTDSGEIPVKFIGRSALLLSPVKDLTLNIDKVEKFGYMAFAGTNNLEKLTLNHNQSSQDDEVWRDFGYGNHILFLESNVKEVYVDAVPSYNLIEGISGINNYYDREIKDFRSIVWNMDIDYFLNPKDMEIGWGELRGFFGQISHMKPNTLADHFYGSINVPGFGKYREKLDEPYNEIWKYSVDKNKGLVAIQEIEDYVTINDLKINGETIQISPSGIYNVPHFDNCSFELDINYTLKGNKNYQTTYSYNYNNVMESTNIDAGIDKILQDTSLSSKDIYNLQGVRVIKNANEESINTLSPGIYIIGGKKVVVK